MEAKSLPTLKHFPFRENRIYSLSSVTTCGANEILNVVGNVMFHNLITNNALLYIPKIDALSTSFEQVSPLLLFANIAPTKYA